MLFVNALGFRLHLSSSPGLKHATPGFAVGGLVIDDGVWIIPPEVAARFFLYGFGHLMRFGEVDRGDFREFREPAPDKNPVGILIDRLLDGRIDADRIDAGHARLHLELAEVNAGFEVEKAPREMQGGPPPVQPEMV